MKRKSDDTDVQLDTHWADSLLATYYLKTSSSTYSGLLHQLALDTVSSTVILLFPPELASAGELIAASAPYPS